MIRRMYWIVISLLLLGFLMLFVFKHSQEKELFIYTDIAQKSFLLVERDDEIVIDLFINHNQTFYTELTYLSTSRLVDDTQEIPITVEEFRFMGSLEFDQIGFLFHYQVVITLDELFQDAFHLELQNTFLILEYDPRISLSLPIGSLDLRHPPVYEDAYLGIFHLYAIPSTWENCPSMSALVIGLEPKQQTPIEIHRINLGFQGDSFAFSQQILVYTPTEAVKPYPQRSDFSSIEEPIILTNQELYLFTEFEPFAVHRFYLSIDYSVHGIHKTLWIDDFIYYSIPIEGGCYERQLHRTLVSDFRS